MLKNIYKYVASWDFEIYIYLYIDIDLKKKKKRQIVNKMGISKINHWMIHEFCE